MQQSVSGGAHGPGLEKLLAEFFLRAMLTTVAGGEKANEDFDGIFGSTGADDIR